LYGVKRNQIDKVTDLVDFVILSVDDIKAFAPKVDKLCSEISVHLHEKDPSTAAEVFV
jgi:hypothetical protein